MTILVLSARGPAQRRPALQAALGEPVRYAGPGEESDGAGALVVDGPAPALETTQLDAVRRFVESGGALVWLGELGESDGFWTDLLGARPAGPAVVGEWFAKLDGGRSGLTQRMDTEVPVHGSFAPLEPLEAATAVVQVSVGFRDRAAVVEHRVGRGRTVTFGLDPFASPDLTRLVRRALRPAPPAPERGLGVAVIGYGPFGGMGYLHGTAAAATEGLALVAVCDSSDERRKAAESDFPGVRAVATVDELLADDDVEVVVVATPPASHAELALRVLRSGRHAVCEKPMCLTSAEAAELRAAADSAGRVLTVNQNRRWDPDFLALRRAVEAGMLGELFNVETFVGGFEHPCRAWHSEVSVSGGAVYDWGSHHVDWILALLGGMPATVSCVGHKRVWRDVTNLDQLRVRMLWEDGREAEFFQSDVAAVRRPKFYVQGTAGTAVGHYRPVTFERLEPGRGLVAEVSHHAEAPVELTLGRYESGYGLTETHLPPAPAPRFAFHRNLADHLHLGEPLAVTPASVAAVIAVLEASSRSAAEGARPIGLEPVAP